MENLLSFLAITLFIATSLNANSGEKIEGDPSTCWEVADKTLDTYRKEMVKIRKISTHEEEFRIWEAAYDGCMAT